VEAVEHLHPLLPEAGEEAEVCGRAGRFAGQRRARQPRAATALTSTTRWRPWAARTKACAGTSWARLSASSSSKRQPGRWSRPSHPTLCSCDDDDRLKSRWQRARKGPFLIAPPSFRAATRRQRLSVVAVVAVATVAATVAVAATGSAASAARRHICRGTSRRPSTAAFDAIRTIYASEKNSRSLSVVQNEYQLSRVEPKKLHGGTCAAT